MTSRTPAGASAVVAVAGPADPQVVWSRYAVIERWAQWAPPIRRVDASAPQLAPGVTGTVHGPLGIRVGFVVLEVDAEQLSWSWRVRSGPIRATMWHEVLARRDGGSAATLRIDGPPGLAAAYGPIARIALSRLVRR